MDSIVFSAKIFDRRFLLPSAAGQHTLTAEAQTAIAQTTITNITAFAATGRTLHEVARIEAGRHT